LGSPTELSPCPESIHILGNELEPASSER
jgi:hypothetical protein